jgi:hypothetical protein
VRLSAVRYPPQSGGQLMPVGVRPSPSRVKRQRGFLRDGLTCAVTPPGLRHRVAEPNPRLAASISRVGGSVLSDHHWGEPIAGLREMARVARRVVVFQWDNAVIPRFGSCATTCRSSLRKHGSPVVRPARGSDQCRDGDRADPVGLRRRVLSRLLATPTRLPAGAGAPSTSVWARVGPQVEQRAVKALTPDLASCAWRERSRDLLDLVEADLAARLLISR